MWRLIIWPGVRCFQSGIFSLRWLKQFFTFGVYQRWICYHSMPVLLHLGISTTSGDLGVECLQPSLGVSGKLCVSFSHISYLSSVQVSGRTCQRSTQTFDSGGTMSNGGSLASHSSQHVCRHFSVVSHHKRSHCGCFSRPCAQGSAISAFNPLTAQRCVLCRQGFSTSICQAVLGATEASMSKVYQQCWKEWAGWCAQEGVSAPKLADFLVHLFRVGIAWCTIDIYHSTISVFWSLVIFTGLLIILSSLN